MKNLIAIAALALTLAGCATITALQQVAGTAVTPTQALLAANAFDAIESGATAFLVYCKSTPTDSTCSAANRREVIKDTRAGRAARNQIETYIQSSSSIPAAIYNTLVAAVTNLRASPAANYAGAQ
jgi:PBP1b-binding outer membrane lipoprotein LpoB